MNTAIDIAKKILYKATNDEKGELVSNLKLQKLLYYMQGYHLAVFNKPLFNEEIEAWMYGPVVPNVYNEYSRFGNKGIECNETPITLSEDEEALFDEVYEVYSQYSAYGLMNLTHKEKPWETTSTGVGNIISKEKIRVFFKTKIS